MKNNPVTDDMMRKEYETREAADPGQGIQGPSHPGRRRKRTQERHRAIEEGRELREARCRVFDRSGLQGKGGDLDWAPAERYVKPFAEALMKLKKGQMTDTPVQTDFGFHVIRLDDERAAKVPSFEEAKPQLQQHGAGLDRAETVGRSARQGEDRTSQVIRDR